MATKELPNPQRQWITASIAESYGNSNISEYMDFTNADQEAKERSIIWRHIGKWIEENRDLIEKVTSIIKKPDNVFLFAVIRKSMGSDFEFTKKLCSLARNVSNDSEISFLKFSTFDFPTCDEKEATEFLSHLMQNDGL